MSLMIIVPHEDDEILIAAGVMHKYAKEGKKISIVMATNGDYGRKDKASGTARLPETIAAAELLGLSADDVTFMGYPDTGMWEDVSFFHNLYHEKDENKLRAGHCSDSTYALPEKPDYHTAKYGTPALYTRKNFKNDLRDIILEKRPELIITTHPEDVHGDHSGLYHFVCEVLTELKADGYKPTLYSGLVHSKAGDDVWPLRDEDIVPYTCPAGQEQALMWDKRISLDVPDSMKEKDLSKNLKAQALAKHKTALVPDAVEYLYTFMKSEELFWNMEY